MYADGRGVAQDDAEAMKWYRLAAEQGNAAAQFNLGVMYERAGACAQDYAEAVKWYRLAAEQGYRRGAVQPRRHVRRRPGVAQDYAEAVKWYRLAAEQGDRAGPVQPRRHVRRGPRRGAGLRRGGAVVPMAAEQGVAQAQFNLGVMYAKGQGRGAGLRRGGALVPEGRRAGCCQAQFNLGVMYAEGRGVAQDYAEAVRWYRKAAEQGDAQRAVQPRRHVRRGPRRGAGLRRGGPLVSARPPSRAIPTRSSTSASCTARAKAWRRTTPRPAVVPHRRRAGLRAGAVQPRRHVRQGRGRAAGLFARRCGGSGWPPSRATRPRSSTSASCTPTAKVCRRTTPRRCGGIVSPPSRATPPRSCALGVGYAKGQGVAQDDAEAMRWFRMAAEQGDEARSSTSALRTPRARAWRRTMSPRICGSISLPRMNLRLLAKTATLRQAV